MSEPRTWDYGVVILVKTVDGDTWQLTLEKTVDDFGFYLQDTKRWESRFRLVGVDIVELRQPRGYEARDYSDWWIRGAITADVLRGQTYKTDNFGRWLIDLYRTDTGEHLDDALRSAGFETPK